MDFQKKDWQFRDLITEGELNRMEDGIEEGITKAEQAQETAESHASRHASGGPDEITPEMIGASSVSDYVRQPGYAVATGSANTYSVTLSPAPSSYVEGMAIAVKINVDNTGASTLNVNGLGAKAIKKPNGNDVSAGSLKANSVYTLRYNGTNFILQGEGGGGGNAQPSDVLSGKTFTNDDGEQIGTMPNRGNVTATLTNQGQQYTIPAGYHAGAGKVTANITNLTADNVRYGATVGGVAGTFSQFANGATAAQILTGRSAAVNGAVVNGTMPNRAGDTAALSSQVVGTTLKLLASAGYRDGVDDYVTITDPDFIAANIRSGVNIFGVSGSLQPMSAREYDNGIEGVTWERNTASSGSVATTTKESSSLYCACQTNITGVEQIACFVTSSPVNLTDVKIILVQWVNLGGNYAANQATVYVSSQKHVARNHASVAASLVMENERIRRFDMLDVSELSGSYYINIGALNLNNITTSEVRIYVVTSRA